MNNRSRNLWSAEEDNTLRRLVEACEKDKVDWRAIASYLPGRNNKDCRKRWHYRVSASMNLGPWSQTEDELLKMGIHRYGTHWSRVAQVVGTRNGDQCFKRWNDVLDPGIDRSPWTREEDQILLLAIGEYGRAWKQIVDAYFPGRTGLDAKNRHRQLTRKRKRECKTTISVPIKTEQRQIKLPSEKLNHASLPSPPASSSSSSSPSMRAGVAHQDIINASFDSPQLNNLDQQQQHHQLELGERSISAPPGSSYSYWELPLEGLFSPQLPTTPYSTCSSTCTSTSKYDGSLSQLDDLQPPPQQRPQSLPTTLDRQYESTFLMNGIPAYPAAQYPYYLTNPHHNRPVDGVQQQQQHLSFLLPGQQDYSLNLQRSTSSSAMHHPFATLDETVTF